MRMRKEDLKLILLIASVASIVLLIRYVSSSPDYYFMSKFAANQEWIDRTNAALARLNIPREVSINPSAQQETIEIFVFDSALTNQIPLEIKNGNCSYLGNGRTILCDVALIRSLISFFDFDKKSETASDENGIITDRWITPETEEQLNRAKLDFMTWALAHELGHLLEGHKGRFYFSDHGGAPTEESQSYCHRIEYEADTYAIRLLQVDAVEDFYLFNYDLLNRELRGLACPDNPKVAFCENVMAGTGLALTDDIIEDVLSGSHPQTIVRILRIGEAAQSRQDFGLFAYQLDQVVETQLEAVGSSSWRCR